MVRAESQYASLSDVVKIPVPPVIFVVRSLTILGMNTAAKTAIKRNKPIKSLGLLDAKNIKEQAKATQAPREYVNPITKTLKIKRPEKR